MDLFRTIVVASDKVDSTRKSAAASAGGGGMFTTPLSPKGHAPATHYISSGFMPEEIVAAIKDADVSDEDPYAVMARMGLQIVQQPEEAARKKTKT